MKKKNTRTTLFVLLVCASISSAVYLSLVSAPTTNTDVLPSIELEEEVSKTQERPLPDVDLLKKVLSVTEKASRLIDR